MTLSNKYQGKTASLILLGLLLCISMIIIEIEMKSNLSEHSPAQVQVPSANWQNLYEEFRENPADQQIAEQLRNLTASALHDEIAQYARAIVERDTGRWAEAEAIFTAIAKQNPRRAGALWNLGRLATQRGDLNQATIYYEQAMQASPHAWQPVYALAQARQMQGQAELARQLFQKANALGAGQPDMHGGMGGMKPDKTMRVKLLEWD